MDSYSYNNSNSSPSPESSTPSPVIPEHALSDQRQKKKHPCTYPNCTRAFTTAGHLARHARVHTGEKNHACPFPGCETRCSRQDNLQQHYRIHLAPGSRRTSARSAADRRSTRSTSTPYPPSVASTSAVPPPPVDSPPQLVPATMEEYQKRYPMATQSSPVITSSWAGDRYSDSSSRAPTRHDSTSSYGGDDYYQRSSPSHSSSYTQSTVLPPLQHRGDDSAYYSQSPSSYSPSTYSSNYSHSPSYSSTYGDHSRSQSYRDGGYSTSGSSYAPRTEVYRDAYVDDYRQQQQFVSV